MVKSARMNPRVKNGNAEPPNRPLNPKQLAFCREYNVDCNGTQAAIRAGYSERTANEQAVRLLANISVKAEIDRLQVEKAKRCELSADYVINAIRSTMERCQQAEPVTDQFGHPTGVYKFDANAVLKGAELLGKHLGLFKESGTKDNPLVVAPVSVSVTPSDIRAINEAIENAC